MGIGTFQIRQCKQKAVYWAAPTIDGFGKKTFPAPVEIDCRWVDKAENFNDTQRTETVLISRSIVNTLIDVQRDGYMYLGLLSSLTTAQKADPETTLQTAYPIKKFDKVPTITDPGYFVRKAYLTNKGN